MITFNQVTKQFPTGTSAIKNASFVIDPGEFVVLVGPSGAGKTTILRLMLREFLPTSGSINIGDYDLSELKDKELPGLRRQIGAAFQDFKLLQDRTAAENIALTLEIIDSKSSEIRHRVKRLLELVGLQGKGGLFPSQLSGGELQRTVIARALATEPAVLFADEPTGNLDQETAFQIIKLLKKINDLGTTVILATHNQNIIKDVKKRQIELKKGEITKDTKPKKKKLEKKKEHKKETKKDKKIRN